jgi:glycosyltransferase involved in cell wall biosynthesis
MRVQLIDPSGDVLPYDHALASALARRGADVELIGSRFVHGPAQEPHGYRVSHAFYPLATRFGARRARLRRALRLAEHAPGMLRLRARSRRADVRHFQWLPLEPLDLALLPPARPRVLTLHNVIRRRRSTRRLAARMDAVIVHTRHGAELLAGQGLDGARVRVIPHGAFAHLASQPRELPLPAELAAVEGPVLLCFGVVRPYKGVDVLVEAMRELPGAELWVVGRPLGVSIADLRARAPRGRVRFVERYVSDAELPAFFRRAELVVLPHREVDVSGVLFAGLAFGKAMVLSDVGGFSELVHDHGAGRLVPAGDPHALAQAIGALLEHPAERRALAERAALAAAGPYSWERIAEQTLELYREVQR